MEFTTKDVLKLKYWKKVDMPEKIRNDKGDFEKTGKSTEMTGYSFHNLVGEEIYFISPKNEFRTLEGKDVKIIVKGVYDDYGRKNKFTLMAVEEIKAK